MANTNIINAVFGSGICAVTTSAFRANYGMVLRFSGIDLPTAFEVDFSNYDVMGRDSITMIGQNNEVQIPDDLWDSGLNIYAYVYLHPTDDSGVTVYTVTIPVLGRPNRTEEQPTPHEQTLIEQAISALNDAVEQTAADVASADASASAAAQSATAAQASAEQAERSVQSITDDVERAERAATTASTKATEAASSAATASTKAAQAEQSATAAAQSASSASTAAQNAAESEQLAESHATDAETAKQAAQDAQAAAEQAAESVSGLSAQIAQNTSDIAELVLSKAGALIDTASGSIASFVPDATVPTVKGLTVNVEPVQDLHGYDNPWPAGGGKNLLNITAETRTINGVTFTISNGTVSLSGTATARTTYNLATQFLLKAGTYKLNGSQQTLPLSCYLNANGGGTSISEAGSVLDVSFTLSEDTTMNYVRLDIASGTNTNGLVFKPMIRLASISDATFAPYSNICPISGWTGAKVTRTGKNMINPSELVYSAGGNNVYYGLLLPHNTDFVFSTDSIITGLYVGYSDADEMPSILGTGWTGITYKYNTTSLRFNSGSHKWYRLMTYEINGVIRDRLYQLELGSTATAYEPYQGDTYTIQLGQTVYGCKIYAVQGKMVVDRANLNLANATALMQNNGVRNGNQLISVKVQGKKYGESNFTSDIFQINVSAEGKYTMHGRAATSVVEFEILFSALGVTESDSIAVRLEAARQWFIAHEPQLVYELATPVTVDLTPLEISVLTGQANNIWADSGDVSVEYAADLKTYINQKIAAAVAALS